MLSITTTAVALAVVLATFVAVTSAFDEARIVQSIQ